MPRTNDAALDAFIVAKTEIDAMLARLVVDLHRFCSGHVLMLGGPLFEGHW